MEEQVTLSEALQLRIYVLLKIIIIILFFVVAGWSLNHLNH